MSLYSEQNISIINFFGSQGIFSALIQKPKEKSFWVFVKGTRVMQTYGFAYKNVSLLEHSIAF